MKQDGLESVRCVTKKQVAELLAVSPHTVTDWCKAGKFPPPFRAMPGAPDRWRLKDVEAWIEKCRRSRAKQSPRGMFAKKPKAEPAPAPVELDPAVQAAAILRARLAFGEQRELSAWPAPGHVRRHHWRLLNDLSFRVSSALATRCFRAHLQTGHPLLASK